MGYDCGLLITLSSESGSSSMVFGLLSGFADFSLDLADAVVVAVAAGVVVAAE